MLNQSSSDGKRHGHRTSVILSGAEAERRAKHSRRAEALRDSAGEDVGGATDIPSLSRRKHSLKWLPAVVSNFELRILKWNANTIKVIFKSGEEGVPRDLPRNDAQIQLRPKMLRLPVNFRTSNNEHFAWIGVRTKFG